MSVGFDPNFACQPEESRNTNEAQSTGSKGNMGKRLKVNIPRHLRDIDSQGLFTLSI